MPELEKQFQKRLVAYKVRISDIVNRRFAKDELSAGYIKLGSISVSRINIIANIVYKSEQGSYATAVIDDGTGRISLRSFENADIFSKIDVGDVVLAVGKLREFNNEKYIVPEILKKTSVEWMNVRKLELEKDGIFEELQEPQTEVEDVKDEDVNQKICMLIRGIDKGDGVAVEEIIKNFSNRKIEGIINRLLANGEIFEVRPGKLKVLE